MSKSPTTQVQLRSRAKQRGTTTDHRKPERDRCNSHSYGSASVGQPTQFEFQVQVATVSQGSGCDYGENSASSPIADKSRAQAHVEKSTKSRQLDAALDGASGRDQYDDEGASHSGAAKKGNVRKALSVDRRSSDALGTADLRSSHVTRHVPVTLNDERKEQPQCRQPAWHSHQSIPLAKDLSPPMYTPSKGLQAPAETKLVHTTSHSPVDTASGGGQEQGTATGGMDIGRGGDRNRSIPLGRKSSTYKGTYMTATIDQPICMAWKHCVKVKRKPQRQSQRTIHPFFNQARHLECTSRTESAGFANIDDTSGLKHVADRVKSSEVADNTLAASVSSEEAFSYDDMFKDCPSTKLKGAPTKPDRNSVEIRKL